VGSQSKEKWWEGVGRYVSHDEKPFFNGGNNIEVKSAFLYA
jgi:hypothetical protein